MPQFIEAISVKTINDISSYCLDCLIKSCYVMPSVIVLCNLVQYMSQGWSVYHVSETTKQIGAGKYFFCSTITRKTIPMSFGRYTIWVLLEVKVCAVLEHFFPMSKT